MGPDHTVRLSGEVADPAVRSGECLLSCHGGYCESSARLAARAHEGAAPARVTVVAAPLPEVVLETHSAQLLRNVVDVSAMDSTVLQLGI